MHNFSSKYLHILTRVFIFTLLCTLGAFPLCSYAQDIFGVLSGTVSDSTGAVIPGAKVTIQNQATKQTRIVTSNDIGFYTAPQLSVGRYTVSGSRDGFATYTVTDVDLNAGGRPTINLALPPQGTHEEVTVQSIGQTINTTSAEIARTVDSQQVQALALNERNYVQLTTIIPGAATISFDQTSMTTGMSTTAASINGMRTDQSLYTIDGGYNLDSGSNSSQLNNVAIEFVHEVSVQASNFSAEYGRNAAASVNVVTRSGGNQFHGGVLEFLRNDWFDAISPASKLNITPTTKIRSIKQALRYNDFGWHLGGPILHEKLFFFGGQEWKKIRMSATPQNLTLPTTTEQIGDFRDAPSIALHTPSNAPAGCTITNNVMTPACITPDGKAIAAVYARMAQAAAAFSNTPTSGNATFQPYNPQNWREDIIRIDFHASAAHSLYFRYLHDDLNLIDAFGTFYPDTNLTLPTSPTQRIRPGYSYQIGHIWTISSHLINEAKFNASWNKQRIPPTGDTWMRSTYNFQFPLPFANAGTYPNGIPHIIHTSPGASAPGTAAPSRITGPYFSLVAPTTDITPSDSLTWQHSNHTFKVGALFARNRKDQNSRPDSYNGRITFATDTPYTTGNPFADSLMGNFSTFAQQSADPTAHFRFNNLSIFAMDSWKVTRNLSFELGMRFEYTTPTYTQGNNMANFDPSQYNTQNAPTSVDASNHPIGGNLDQGYVITGLVRPGSVPKDQYARVPNANSTFVTSVPATAPRGFFKAENLISPRIGVAYALPHDTSIRSGFGVFYDKPEGNIIFGQPGVVPFLQSVSYQFANLNAPSGGPTATPTIFSMSAIDPKLLVARSYQYSLSVQSQLKYGVLVEGAYVGNVGRHQLRQPNINVPSFATVLAAKSGTKLNQIRPYLGYGDITQFRSDANSNYNGLQLSAAKRRGDLLVTANYTFSKALGDVSGEADNPEPECAFSCTDAQGNIHRWNNFYYGNLSFDRRHILSTTYTYSLPFFKHQRNLAGEVLSGWQLSGITKAQSGQRLTVSGNAAIGPSGTSYSRRASVVPGVSLHSGYTCPAQKICVFNPNAFQLAPSNGVGNASVGNVGGPGYFGTDLSLRKTFGLWSETSNLLIQMDAFNAFNQTNWQNPGTGVGGGLGQTGSANPPRNVQFGAKITF